MATRPEPLEALGGAEPDVAASVATTATAVLPSTTDMAAHERFIRPNKSTVPLSQAAGSGAWQPCTADAREVRSSPEGKRPNCLEPAMPDTGWIATMNRLPPWCRCGRSNRSKHGGRLR